MAATATKTATEWVKILKAHPLTGSLRQRKWGHQVRQQVVRGQMGTPGMTACLLEMIKTQLTAKYWIEVRNSF